MCIYVLPVTHPSTYPINTRLLTRYDFVVLSFYNHNRVHSKQTNRWAYEGTIRWCHVIVK